MGITFLFIKEKQKFKFWHYRPHNSRIQAETFIKERPLFLLDLWKTFTMENKQNSGYNAEQIKVIERVGSKIMPLSTLKLSREFDLFSRKHNISGLQVRELYNKVKKWRTKLEKNPQLLLNSLQHDLIMGSTMGDANIRQRDRNCNFRVGHTKKQEKYLLFKYEILKEFTKSGPKWSLRTIKENHKVKTLEMATKTHYVFNHYRKLFYKGGEKTITRELLNLLTPRSLAFWICDDGSYENKQGYNTHSNFY